MAVIKYDMDGMSNNVILPLNNSKKSLSLAQSYIRSISIPTDFYYYNTLKRMPYSIDEIMQRVNNVNKWAKDVINKFSIAESKNKSLVNGIKSNISTTNINTNTGAKTTTVKNIQETPNVLDTILNTIELGWETGAAIVTDWFSDLLETMKDGLGVILNAVGAVLSDAANLVISLIEGMAEVIENLSKVGLIAQTAARTVVTATIDGLSYLEHMINGDTEDFTSRTAEMWKNTMSYVSENHVKSAFDNFYKNTTLGKILNENAHDIFKSDGIVTQIASGVGYTVGIATLSLLTGGSAVVIAGTAAVGKNTGEYWANDKNVSFENIIKGMAYGGLNGLWEGVQWYVGGELNNWNANSKLTTSTVRVAADTLFNGLDTPYRTIVEKITTDKSWQEAWEDQGSWTSVLSSVAIGLIGSIGGEVLEYYKSSSTDVGRVDRANASERLRINLDGDGETGRLIYDGQTTRLYTQIESLEEAIEITLKKYGIEPRDYLIRDYKLKILSGEYTLNNITRENGARYFVENYLNELNEGRELLQTFSKVMKSRKSSDEVIDLMYKTIKNGLEDGNLDAVKFLKKVIELKQENPKLKFKMIEENTAYWSTESKSMHIGEWHINIGDIGTLAHESGHMLFTLELNRKLPDNVEDILGRARVYSSDTGNIKLYQITEKFKYIYEINYNAARQEIEGELQSMGYSTIEDYIQRQAMSQKVSKDVIAKQLEDIIKSSREAKDRLLNVGDVALSDIIDALYLGEKKDLNGNELWLSYHHGKDYYSNLNSEEVTRLAFDEMIANFTQLKITGQKDSLNAIKDIFGQEFYDMLEDTFNSFFD